MTIPNGVSGSVTQQGRDAGKSVHALPAGMYDLLRRTTGTYRVCVQRTGFGPVFFSLRTRRDNRYSNAACGGTSRIVDSKITATLLDCPPGLLGKVRRSALVTRTGVGPVLQLRQSCVRAGTLTSVSLSLSAQRVLLYQVSLAVSNVD